MALLEQARPPGSTESLEQQEELQRLYAERDRFKEEVRLAETSVQKQPPPILPFILVSRRKDAENAERRLEDARKELTDIEAQIANLEKV